MDLYHRKFSRRKLAFPYFTHMRKRSITLLLAIVVCAQLAGQSRPNIIWIVSEDNSIHFMDMFYEGGAKMPNLEALAEDGIKFRKCFSQAPVCSVARSTLISGCYAPRIGAQYHRRETLVPMPEGIKMFPAYLKDEGYYTSNNSKEDYNLIKTEGVWDESSRNASYRNRTSNQPFFHVQNFGTTHEGRLHFPAADLDTLKTSTDPEGCKPHPHHPDTDLFRYSYARYHDQHAKVDLQIGEFIEQLKSDGVYQESIIFYYGDHGGVLPGSKGYIYERGLHVPLIVRVPVKWQHLAKGLTAGGESEAFVRFMDFGPTVLNLAGIDVPKHMDGEPFLGGDVSVNQLKGRNTVYSYADRFDEKYDLTRALRIGKYKYIRNFQPFNVDGLQNNYRYKMQAYEEWRRLYREGKLNEAQAQFFEPRSPEALYDVEKDPFEINNLALDASHQERLLDLRKRMNRKIKSLPDLSLIPEPIFVAEGAEDPVQYGRENKGRIRKLVDIADLALMPLPKAEKKLKKALRSKDALYRYWAVIAMASFGENGRVFIEPIRSSLEDERDRLVKLRAYEFLTMMDTDHAKDIEQLLKTSEDPIEANLILNTIVLLKDHHQIVFSIMEDSVDSEWLENKNNNVARRILYLTDKLSN